MYLHSNIKFLRNYVHLTQAEFGKLFGWSRSKVDNYERATAKPKGDSQIALAKHFNIPLEVLHEKDLTMNPGLLFAGASVQEQKNTVSEDTIKAKDETIRELKTTIKRLEEHIEYLKIQNDRLLKKLKVA